MSLDLGSIFQNVARESSQGRPNDGPNIIEFIESRWGLNKSGRVKLYPAQRVILKVFYSLKTPCSVDFFTCVTRVLKQQAREHEKLLASL